MQADDVSREPRELDTRFRTRVLQSIRDDRSTQFIVVASLFALGFFLVLIYVGIVFHPLLEPATIGTELIKALVQLTVVALGGAVIAGIATSVERDREKREAVAERARERRRRDVDYLMTVLREVTDAYNTVKFVHRKLKGKNVQQRPSRFRFSREVTEQQLALIEQQMDVLDNAQLSLETMMRATRVRRFVFQASDGTSLSRRLPYCLRQMEAYLNDVVDDTRKHPQTMPLLLKFLGNYDAVGGIRKGDKVYNLKDLQPGEKKDWNEQNEGEENGPTVHLRHIEHLIAEMIPLRIGESDDHP
jgi:hypothetical protein